MWWLGLDSSLGLHARAASFAPKGHALIVGHNGATAGNDQGSCDGMIAFAAPAGFSFVVVAVENGWWWRV